MPQLNPFDFGKGQSYPDAETIGQEELVLYLDDLRDRGIDKEVVYELRISNEPENRVFNRAWQLAFQAGLDDMMILDSAQDVIEGVIFEAQRREGRLSALLSALGSTSFVGLAVGFGYGAVWLAARKKHY
jgi:hypothetical protein